MAFGAYAQNPYQPMQMMQSGYPYQQPQQQPALTLSGRMVTSREEALATPVDFMAGMTFLPDMSHGRIYVKIFNRSTGGADVVEFAPAQPEAPRPDPTEELAARVKKLEDEIAEAKRRGAMNARRRAEENAD